MIDSRITELNRVRNELDDVSTKVNDLIADLGEVIEALK
jgi:hypothetical protein